MGSTTTRAGLPYPVGTDRVMDGDDAIRALAQRLDGSDAGGVASVPQAFAAGQVTVSVPNATQGTVGVTFPVGRFTLAPRLGLAFAQAASSVISMVRTSGTPGISNTGFTVVVNTVSAVNGSYIVDWYAVQMTTAAASG